MKKCINQQKACLVVIKMFRFIGVIACLVLFILLTFGTFDSYIREDVTVINSQKRTDKWPMPTIIACLRMPFKHYDTQCPFSMLTLEDYEINTFDPTEYIHVDRLHNFKIVDVLYTKMLGKCAVMKIENEASFQF